jgi:hypothetical protein
LVTEKTEANDNFAKKLFESGIMLKKVMI